MTGKKRASGSDLKKVDAHVIQPEEYDEIPELTEEFFARADLYHGGKLVQRGRPKSDAPKQLVSLRLDAEVLRWFKATGAGYQARMGEVLKSHMTRKKKAEKKAG
ncbi:BrnA antitoxin family protein [Rhodopseudomonas palustris]|uniref:BrnA antitoxin family protein n=1 Tax=Rhodopseudomonas palustris (strain BisB18) TaxID=316056 RepID=Q20YH7_RHOPB